MGQNFGFGGGLGVQTQQQSTYDPLGGLLGMGTSNPTNALSPGLPGVGGGFTSTNTATSPQSAGAEPLIIKAVEDNNLEVLFQCKKVIFQVE